MTETQPVIPAMKQDRTPNLDMRFPPLPRTVVDVSNLAAYKKDVPDTPELVRIVNADPVVTTSVLRRINSAYYGMGRRVGDLHKAVFLLGFEEVCDIVLTAGLMRLGDVLRSTQQKRIFEQIMRMSIGTAAYARKIATHLQVPQHTAAFTTGLLHTVGRLVLLYNRSDDYEALWLTNDHGFAPSVASEQIIFGTDHTELGGLAAESWHLPELVARLIRHYLTPGRLDEPGMRMLALTLSVSATATERFCLTKHDEPPVFEANAALYSLGRLTQTTPEELIALIEGSRKEVCDYTHHMVDVSD